MTYKFFFLDYATAKADPTKIGYKYAKLHESEWVDGPSGFVGNLTSGVNKGIDNAIHDGKAYLINRVYFDVDNDLALVICVESIFGGDTKEVFN